MNEYNDKTTVAKFLLQSLNMALSLDGETSYTNSFDIEVTAEGFFWIPRVPCSFIINSELYQRIYAIASGVLYPMYTLLKQNGAYFVPVNTDDIHIKRAFFFPWMIGIARRIQIPDISKFANTVDPHKIPIMENFTIDFDKITHIAIAGNSGSGKSFNLIYWLNILKLFCDLVVIDPKFDSPSRWAVKNNIKLVYPNHTSNQNDFVSQVNDELSQADKLIAERQRQLFENSKIVFKHKVIVIDELLALSTVASKQIKDSFFSLLSQIALLGRSTNVHLLTVSQRYDHNTLPVACREQFNLMIQLGNINRKTTQFLFPDLEDSDEIVIPKGIGTGLLQIIDGVHPSNVFPLLTPTFKDEDGIL